MPNEGMALEKITFYCKFFYVRGKTWGCEAYTATYYLL